MSNVIPPLLSSTPPPIGNIDDEDDDFGDFTAADYSFSCDAFSIPNTPHDTPKKTLPVINSVDINSNSSHLNRLTEKDHQDKRKDFSTPLNTILPDLSAVPSDLDASKDQNVPSPSLKTDDFYREEPPEIVDDVEDDFGDFEYNPGLSIDQEDEESNMEIPEVVDFTCSEFIEDINEFEDVKIKDFNEINSVKSKSVIGEEKTEMKFENIVNEEISETAKKIKNIDNEDQTESSVKLKNTTVDEKNETLLKSKSESIENSEDSFNVINDDDDFGDFEFQSATTFNDKIEIESNSLKCEEQKKVEVLNFEAKDVDDSKNDFIAESSFNQRSDSEIMCNGMDKNLDFEGDSKSDETSLKLESKASKGESSLSEPDNDEKPTELQNADNSKFSLNSDDDTLDASEFEVNKFKPANFDSSSDQHIPKKFSENSNFEMTDNHKSDVFDLSRIDKEKINDSHQILASNSSEMSNNHNLENIAKDNNLKSGHEREKPADINECNLKNNDSTNETESINSTVFVNKYNLKGNETSDNKSKDFQNPGCNNDENTTKNSGNLENSDFDDDFGDFADFRTLETKNFETASSFTLEVRNSIVSGEEKTKSEDLAVKKKDKKTSTFENLEIPTKSTEVDFAATNDSPIFETNFPSFESNEVGDEDFGEFDDYTSSAAAPVMLAIDSKNVGEKAEAIFEVMFPKTDQVECEDYHSIDFITVDGVFKEMKDITDTNALTYQWGKSRTQKDLLKSLNIDTRNILYGPGINPMPKFAANLGLIPLEPVKSEILTPIPVSIPSTTPSQSNPAVASVDIPTAQFDWSESGLANPLDSVSKEEETQNQENTTITNNTTPVTPRKSFDNESVNSLQFAEIPNDTDDQKPPEDDDFSDFTSFKSNTRNHLNNMVPLRESYINNAEIKNNTTDEPGWLKPTILTPVLPRKYEPEIEDEDEFTDFQMSLPPKTGLTVLPVQNEEGNGAQLNIIEANILKPISGSNTLLPAQKEVDKSQMNLTVLPNDVLKPTSDLTVLQKDEANVLKPVSGLKVHSEEANPLKPSQHEETNILKPKQNEGINISKHTQIFLRNDCADVLQPVQKQEGNILQPMQVFKPSEEAVINWPDPGITEEELARFEMYSKASNVVEKKDKSPVERKMSGNTGLMLVEKSVVVPANKVVLPSKEVLLPPNDKVVISKDLVLPILESSPRKYTPLKHQRESKEEEDDWTDFISIKPVQNLQNERTATPELPLSIPQLSHIQPPKLPIPVITPQGLMQTKIPSAPTAQAKNPQAVLHLNPPQDGYQPAIISHQYQMQMNQNVFSGVLQNASYQTTSIPANIRATPTHQINANGVKSSSSSFDDSEEWTDFVSSRPTANGLSNPPSLNAKSNPSAQNVRSIPTPQSAKHNYSSQNTKPNISSQNPNLGYNKSPQFNNWNSPLTSSNPYMTSNPFQNHNFQNLSSPRPNGLSANLNKNNIPSISALPDLDFVTAKNRTFSKK